MIDAGLIQAIVAGATAALSTVGLANLLLKGDKVVLARELSAERASRKDVEALKDAEIKRLQTALIESQKELREQHGVTIELTQRVFVTIDFLQSLAGLAQRDQRQASQRQPGD